VDALSRDPLTQAGWFPDVTFHRMLGVSFRPPGLLRRMESSLGFAWGLLRTAFSIVTGIGTTPMARLFRDADLVIAAPGGYLEDVNIGILMHTAHLWLAVLAKKPVILAPQSVGPLQTRVWRGILRYLLARVHLMCIREGASHALAHSLLENDRRLHLVPDMAFQDDSADLDAAQRELARLGLASQPFIAMTVSDGDVPFYAGPPAVRGSLECLAEFCAKLQRDGIRVLVWTQAASGGGMAGDEDAMRRFEKIAPSNVVVSYECYPPSQIRGILHHARAVVSQRMHPCIFAAQVGRPVVSLAIASKTRSVLSMLQIEKVVLDGKKPDADALYQRLKEVLAEPGIFMEAQKRAHELGDRSRMLFTGFLLDCWRTSSESSRS
jgi:colanic acid/amylovoran biosynthesis protein